MHSTSEQSNLESGKTSFYKLSYIGKYCEQVQKKFSKIFKKFYKDTGLKIDLLLLKSITISQLKIKHLIFLKNLC